MSGSLDFVLIVATALGMMASPTIAIGGILSGLVFKHRDHRLFVSAIIGVLYACVWIYLTWRDGALTGSAYAVFPACPIAVIIWALAAGSIRDLISKANG